MIIPKPLIQEVIRINEKEPSRYYKVRLDRSERTQPFSDEFINRIRARLDSEWISTYPEPEPVYEKCAAFLGQPRGRLMFNSGSDQSIKSIFETYIGPGDKVLLHRPGYAMFPVYTKMFGAEAIYQDFDSDLNFDYEGYIGRINNNVRMAVLENPNGFIGVAPPEDLLREFVRACERNGVICVVDEAYFFFHDITAADMLDIHENLIVVRTFSKAMGLAGLRAGYLLSRTQNIDSIYKVKPMHELNGLAILVMDELLDHTEEILSFTKETRKCLQYLKDRFAAMGIETSRSVANFLAARLGTQFSGEQMSLNLRDKGILLRRPFREEHLRQWTRIGTAPVEKLDLILDMSKELIRQKIK
ncbi:MAG: histidinol-phosphate aminotransferase family protein [Nitrospirae bacterium]|nr:histidinol-phosphate aminotransferase family protein [Nitrospirota bacterium]